MGGLTGFLPNTGKELVNHLALILRELSVGDKVKLTVYREGEVREVEFVLPERPLMPSDLPEGQAFVAGPRRGNENQSPAQPAK